MPPQTLAAVAALVSFAPHGNRIELALDHGSAELVWVTPATFRFRRALSGPLPESKTPAHETVPVEIEDNPGRLVVRSRRLEVTIRKNGVLLAVRRADGQVLLDDMSEPRPSGPGVVWERRRPPDARLYGLGPHTSHELDLRDRAVTADRPFLLSSAGYAEFHAAPGSYRFDFTAAGLYRIEAPAVDYYFHAGAAPKQIFEEHAELDLPDPAWNATPDAPGSWDSLASTLLRVVHGAISGMMAPTLSLRPWVAAPEELQRRARQLGSLVDDVSPGPLGLSDLRGQLETFLSTYAQERHDRGFPIWHPLPFQFPQDPECARHADEFLLGDELLVAPVYEPGGKRQVYLPQGVWTNLETGRATPGRQIVAVETAGLPVFARNGTILPLDSPGGVALHYFPTLPAEFFIFEPDPPQWSQIHAAPAADIVRLQIESKRARQYQWVVHHVDRPAEVGFEGTRYPVVPALDKLVPGTWFYDAGRRNLHVLLRVAAGEDRIVNLVFP